MEFTILKRHRKATPNRTAPLVLQHPHTPHMPRRGELCVWAATAVTPGFSRLEDPEGCNNSQIIGKLPSKQGLCPVFYNMRLILLPDKILEVIVLKLVILLYFPHITSAITSQKLSSTILMNYKSFCNREIPEAQCTRPNCCQALRSITRRYESRGCKSH